MKIAYENYYLEPESHRFNLFKKTGKKLVDKKTGEEKDVDDNLGWGMSFEHCLEIIVKDILAEREETISLKEYISQYNELHKDVLKYVVTNEDLKEILK